jgi:zinc/manganese transport system substrate-binding protein
VPRARSLAALAALAALSLSACGSGGSAGASAVSQGDPGTCPGHVVDVVVSVGQWGNLVRALGGACATVTTIVSSAAIDPHDFEPGTSALTAFSHADVVVLNGAGYDHWAEDAIATVDPAPVVVSAARAAGVAAQGVDPHLWYSPEAVHRMTTAVGAALSARAGHAAAGYLAEQVTAWDAELQRYDEAVREVAGVASGHSFAATEPVFDRMAAAVGLTDATPEGYRRASSNGSDPAPGDLTAFESALTGGGVDVLVYNTQTSGTVPEQLRRAAEGAGVPVVDVSESPTDPSGSFVAWQVGQLTELSKVLGP